MNTFFEQQEEDYQKPVTVGNFWGNNYEMKKCENSDDINKTLSVKEFVDEIKLYFKDIIINLLTIATNFISSEKINKECVVH